MGWGAKLSVTVARGTCTAQSSRRDTPSSCGGLSSPKKVHREAQITASGTGTVYDEFSSWYKSYFLNNSSLNIVVFSRCLKPLSMSCFSIMGLQVASCFHTLLFWLLWERFGKNFLSYCLNSMATEAKRRVLLSFFSLQQEQLEPSCRLHGRTALPSPRPCHSQPWCVCQWVEDTLFLFVQPINVYWVY